MKIGSLTLSNTMALAPMAGVSDYPFRTICRDYGCQLAYSEMVSSEGLVRGGDKTISYLYKGKEEYDDGKIIGFQIFGSEPDVMAEAAEIVEGKGADIVDINMGCPVKKVTKTKSGSALLGDLPLLRKISSAVRKRIKVPFTVKIRAGWKDEVNAVEVAQILEDCGVDAVILHPRTQKEAFKGQAHWDLIKKVKENVKIPVIGNGDVVSIEDYHRMMSETSCNAVMIGRGAMGNPWIFKTLDDPSYQPTMDEMKRVILKHYRLSIEFYGKEKAVREMRKHLSWYTKGLSEGSLFRTRINTMTQSIDVIQEIETFFARQTEKTEA